MSKKQIGKKENQTFLNIPDYILQDRGLNPTDKLVMGEIDYLDKCGDAPGCWEKNKKMAKFLGVCVDTITNSIKRLLALGRIRYDRIDNHRYVYSNYPRKVSDTKSEGISTKPKISKPMVSDKDSEGISIQNLKVSDTVLKVSDTKSEETLSIDNKEIIIDQKRDHNRKNNTIEKTSTVKSSSESNSKKTSNKKNFEVESPPYDLAVQYYAAQIDYDSNIHLEFIDDDKKLQTTLQTWARAFNWLIEQNHDSEEISKVIKYVFTIDFWGNAKYSAAYLKQNYRPIRNMMLQKKSPKKYEEFEVVLPDDPNPEFTARLIKRHRRFQGPNWQPTNEQKAKFIQATIRIFHRSPNLIPTQQGYLIDDLIECLDERYFAKGETVYPGHYCSSNTWDTLLPQYWLAMGVPADRFMEYRKDQVDIEEECK